MTGKLIALYVGVLAVVGVAHHYLDSLDEAKHMTGKLIALYVGVLAVVGVAHHYLDSLDEAKRMSNIWVVLKDNVKVEAKPAGIWTVALDWVDGPSILKFEAGDEEWFYSESDASKTRADGHLTSLIACKNCLFQNAPVGALIGKIGGSSAGTADGTVFVVGKFTLLEIDKSRGPIYLTINDELTGFANNRGAITVKISSRPAPAGAVLTPPTPAPSVAPAPTPAPPKPGPSQETH